MLSSLTLGILGGGPVGRCVAKSCFEKGYGVILGSEHGMDPDWLHENEQIRVTTYDKTAQEADVLFLALKGKDVAKIVEGVKDLIGDKVVVDMTNAVEEKTDESVTLFQVPGQPSLMAYLQSVASEAKFVKALNYFDLEIMTSAPSELQDGGQPQALLCGDDQDAKESIKFLLSDFGWIPLDLGGSNAAGILENLYQLNHFHRAKNPGKHAVLNLYSV